MRVLIIDNYDSFVYNLAQQVGSLADEVIVRRNNDITAADARQIRPDRIIISPGPGTPTDTRYFGSCSSIITGLTDVPILGVCLGHQGIAHAFGARIVKAHRLRHGKTSQIRHDRKGVLRGLSNPLEATRYHSLVVERRSLPSCLEVSAQSLDDNEIMGIRHRQLPIEGVQFHPESILTTEGNRLIENFLGA